MLFWLSGCSQLTPSTRRVSYFATRSARPPPKPASRISSSLILSHTQYFYLPPPLDPSHHIQSPILHKHINISLQKWHSNANAHVPCPLPCPSLASGPHPPLKLNLPHLCRPTSTTTAWIWIRYLPPVHPSSLRQCGRDNTPMARI